MILHIWILLLCYLRGTKRKIWHLQVDLTAGVGSIFTYFCSNNISQMTAAGCYR